jgi:hypothetical protein
MDPRDLAWLTVIRIPLHRTVYASVTAIEQEGRGLSTIYDAPVVVLAVFRFFRIFRLPSRDLNLCSTPDSLTRRMFAGMADRVGIICWRHDGFGIINWQH